MPAHDAPAPALKDIFDAARFRRIADDLEEIDPAFDRKKFLSVALAGLDALTLMQRLRRTTDALHAALNGSYRKRLGVLKQLAPRLPGGLVSLTLPDYVSQHGLNDFDASMEALKFFTPFGSSEFAIREFLRRDLPRTLAVMEHWSRDPGEHVRRLASEGSRPRLPWSFRLAPLIADPSPTAPILENLRADPSLYVRKSVANHLNDITKDHPGRVLSRLRSWPLENPHTAWIARHALRTLIKKGDSEALALVGAHGKPEVAITRFEAAPARLRLGERLTLCLALHSTAPAPQRLVIDYIIHYVKKSGAPSAKVFKWKEANLAPGESLSLSRSQEIRNFTTRVHYPGRHVVEASLNGERLARCAFDLVC